MGDNPPGKGGSPGRYQQARCGLELYNLASDISETKDVAAQHPDVVARLKALADRAREALGDSATKIKGKEVRPAGQL
jgi:squalene cyclase